MLRQRSLLVAALTLLSVVGLLAGQQHSPAGAPVLRYGRLLDVYAPARLGGPLVPVRRGVLAAPEVLRDVPEGCRSLPADPDSLRRRIAILHPPGSAAFDGALHTLESGGVVAAAGGGEIRIPRDAAWIVTWPDDRAAASPEVSVRTEGGGPATIVVRPQPRGVVVETVVMGTAAQVAGGPCAYGLPAGSQRLRIAWDRSAVEVSLRAEDFLPDAEPLRIVGELPTFLEHVGRRDAHTFVLTLLVSDVRQSIARGDVLRVVDPANGKPRLVLEALADVPVAASGGPPRVHVPVTAVDDRDAADTLLRLDPSRQRGYPDAGAARDTFVRARGAVVMHVACFDAARGDDPANFVRVEGRAVTSTQGNRLDVSPHAGFAVRFTGPVDPGTLRALQLTTPERDSLIAARLTACDATDTAFELRPPLGMSMTPSRRRAIEEERSRGAAPSPDLVLEVVAGVGGLATRSGARLEAALAFAFQLDPAAPDNFVGQRVWVLPLGR